MPSNLPPVGCVSMWLPVEIGGRFGFLPARRMNTLPILSIVTVRPACWPTRHDKIAALTIEVGQRETADAALLRAADAGGSMSEVQRRSPLTWRVRGGGHAPSPRRFREVYDRGVRSARSNRRLLAPLVSTVGIATATALTAVRSRLGDAGGNV